MFPKRTSFFVSFVCNDGALTFQVWPARGSLASVSDHPMTRQEKIKVEHVRT